MVVRRRTGETVSSRTCPDWPDLMEIAPELQFKHYTVAEAQLPADALMQLTDVALSDVAICADLDHNVFYAAHTDENRAEPRAPAARARTRRGRGRCAPPRARR